MLQKFDYDEAENGWFVPTMPRYERDESVCEKTTSLKTIFGGLNLRN